MSPRPCPRSTVRQALWLGGLLVVLGGLLGMHGLDNHGRAGMGAVGHADMAASAHITAAAHGIGYAVLAQVSHEAAAAAAEMTGSGGQAGMGMGVTGMCAAVLVLGLFALLLRLQSGRARPLLWRLGRQARAPAAPGRDPGPPSLFSLSIQRC
jgi:hypothetical protein